MNEITINWEDSKTIKKARKYKMNLESFEFIVYTVFLEDIMATLKPLAVLFQKIDVDIYEGLKQVEIYVNRLNDKIESPDSLSNFKKLIFDEALQIYQSLISQDSIERGVMITHRKVKTYFENYAKMISQFKESIELRLEKRELLCAKLTKLHPLAIKKIVPETVDEIAETYFGFIGENNREYAKTLLKKEINLFQKYSADILKEKSFSECLIFMQDYPALKVLYEIVITTAVTNSSAERTFSKLKIVKTKLRNRLSDQNLTNEALISMNRDYKLDIRLILDDFCQNIRINV